MPGQRWLPAAFLLACAAAGLAPGTAPARAEKPTGPAIGPASTVQVDRGRRLFIRCVACHSVRAQSPLPNPNLQVPNLQGPNLHGIVGRKAGSLAGFRYTTALKDQPFIWTGERLEQWLRQPQKDMPGLCLPFTGFSRKADRAALVAYLAHPQP